MLAKVASHYGLGPVVSIVPHNSPLLLDRQSNPRASSYPDFLNSITSAGVAKNVEIHVARSAEMAASWDRPIRLLWIDGDHSYEGTKTDLDGFLPHVMTQGVVAFHDALNAFPGPIRVFVEDVLRSAEFGAAGFVHSIAWSQFKPGDAEQFQSQRASLDRVASRLIPLLPATGDLRGSRKLLYKLMRSRVPRSALTPAEWASSVTAK